MQARHREKWARVGTVKRCVQAHGELGTYVLISVRCGLKKTCMSSTTGKKWCSGQRGDRNTKFLQNRASHRRRKKHDSKSISNRCATARRAKTFLQRQNSLFARRSDEEIFQMHKNTTPNPAAPHAAVCAHKPVPQICSSMRAQSGAPKLQPRSPRAHLCAKVFWVCSTLQSLLERCFLPPTHKNAGF